MANTIITPETGHINLSPLLFREYARQYLACKAAFHAAPSNSPVPYFLVCRSIELSMKAKHLQSKSRLFAKNELGHNLKKSYDALPESDQILNSLEYGELVRASKIYNTKGFEYVSVWDAVTGLKDFPSILLLEQVAVKLVEP